MLKGMGTGAWCFFVSLQVAYTIVLLGLYQVLFTEWGHSLGIWIPGIKQVKNEWYIQDINDEVSAIRESEESTAV